MDKFCLKRRVNDSIINKVLLYIVFGIINVKGMTFIMIKNNGGRAAKGSGARKQTLYSQSDFYPNSVLNDNETQNDPQTGNGNTDNGDAVPEQGSDEQINQIKEMGSVTETMGEFPIYCLTIVGEIEGHFNLPAGSKATRYEHVIPQLIAIEEDPKIKGLLIVLNTMGGDVEAGLAIAELISGMRKPTVSLVLGGGHSIGVPLAVAAKRSFIAPSATMTVHPVRTNGLVVGVQQTLDYFERMQDRIVNFVVENSKITKSRLSKLMMKTGEQATDMGSILNGRQAVEMGLIDHLGKLSDALEALYDMMKKKDA